MKTKTAATIAGALCILITSAMAQSGPANNGGSAAGTNVIATGTGTGTGVGTGAGSGPQYKRQATPAEVQAQLKQFKQERDAFMAKQATLEQKLKTASEADRDAIRQQLHDQMEQFKQDQARVQDQMCDQSDRQRTQLRDHTRILDRTASPSTTGTAASQTTRSRGR
jgi:hypothetical protein